MSYGKDDSQLGRIGGYGATASQQMGNAMRRQSAPRKGAPSWAGNFQPSESTPDHVRLIPGEYPAERRDQNGNLYTELVPWFEHAEHYHATNKRSMICSGGIDFIDEKKSKPCRGCDIWREDLRERQRIEREQHIKPQGPKRISRQSKYAFNILDYGTFFKGFRLDERGQPRMNKNSGQPYTDWIKYYDSSQPEFVLAYHESQRSQKQIEWRQGMVFPWPVGFGQFTTLNAHTEIIQKHCKNCGNQHCISTSGWVCPRCSCPTMQEGTTLPQDELKKLVSQEVICRNCQTKAYPRPVLACRFCQNPTPASIYDVDMQVFQARVNKTPQLQIPWSSGPKPIDQNFLHLLQKLPDLPKKFAPTPYEEQVALFGQGAQQMVAPPPTAPAGNPWQQQPMPYGGGQPAWPGAAPAYAPAAPPPAYAPPAYAQPQPQPADPQQYYTGYPSNYPGSNQS